MKATIFFIALIACLFPSMLSAQITNTWRGGAPGHESDWHFYKNWSLGKIPDEFHSVVIPDVSTSTQRYPVIHSGEVEVLSLEIRPNACLTVSGSARLWVTEWENRGECTGCKARVLVEKEVQAKNMAITKH